MKEMFGWLGVLVGTLALLVGTYLLVATFAVADAMSPAERADAHFATWAGNLLDPGQQLPGGFVAVVTVLGGVGLLWRAAGALCSDFDSPELKSTSPVGRPAWRPRRLAEQSTATRAERNQQTDMEILERSTRPANRSF